MNSKYYKLTAIDGKEYILGPTGQFPLDPDNRDYQAYLAWVAEGNEAEEWSAE
jgi:hypothetical protein